jgi:hypothetical protein
MMRLYEQGSSRRLKAVGFRPNYVGGIFYEDLEYGECFIYCIKTLHAICSFALSE